ncbi:E3 ISG15--protein ligase HERC5 [Toxorhynchites rutilus septentrionalis]|uniref:E3 ISG15--protein ligase HERC5 n=1 Tax=Toxorhynchites rutilus septentrionalis TaxID=329112 RepID=UPI002479B8ED|nr:E3 ISG15--protein ligase HERC5 [Toxorhynchites rutilus septentrionalis]
MMAEKLEEVFPKIWTAGLNPLDLSRNGKLHEINLNDFFKVKKFSTENTSNAYIIEFTSTHVLIASGQTLYSNSAITQNAHCIDFDSQIVQLSACTWYCLVLLVDGNLFKYDFHENRHTKLDFLTVENAMVSDEKETITHLACGDKLSIAITSRKSVFTIPNRVFTFPKHIRIAKVAAGLEHCLLLTSNGDCYSWGGGLRGQLGNGEITPHYERPQLIEALAGVKILDIAAGGWHSGAVSSFGDLYTWGWNSKGQLGLEGEKRTRGSVFALPQLLEVLDADGVEVSFEKIYCGNGYSAAISTTGAIYYAGDDITNKIKYQQIQKEAKTERFKFFDTTACIDGKIRLKSGPNTIIFMNQMKLASNSGE